ncbi:MAG: dephospho-CoA kinase [Planctomycetota bacterium]|nr:dephospho-CoA kinase [Planctomycetota bacterium]
MAEKGAQVLEADAVGHALLDQPPTREPLIERFGEQILDFSGLPEKPPTIDRRKLAAIVFSDDAALKALEGLLHPRMRQTFEKAISRAARKRQATAVVLDAAVLFEAKWHDLCDVIVFVDAPADVRLARLVASRDWTAENLATRERVQMSLDTKRGRADFVLENHDDDAALSAAVDSLWDKLVRRPKTDPPRPSRLPRIEPDPAPDKPKKR